MELSLAPIQGMTNAAQRNIYSDLFEGMDVYYAPFIAISHMRKRTSPQFRDILPKNNNCSRLVPQLLGNNAEDFRFYAKVIKDHGYDEINWNIGCPFPMLTKKRRGSGILPYPDDVDAFLDTVCRDLDYRLTLKMRLGLDTPEEGLRLLNVLNAYPIDTVILHGRTGSQMYDGTVDLDAFQTLYEACNHPMVYNGDIFSVEDYRRVTERFPEIDRFMLGRGALRNPFLASDIKGIDVPQKDRFSKFKSYHDDIYSYYHSEMKNHHLLCSKMKEFWVYASHGVDKDGAFLKTIRQCQTLEAYDQVVADLFTSMAP